jgi:NADH-quinone oxidoreductase subunit M
MPWLYLFFLVITLGALGLPGTNGFVGEFTIMLGAFQYFWLLAVLAGLGVVLASWYMLRMHQGMMHEPTRPVTEKVRDLRLREGLVLAPLAALIVFLGVYPHPVGAVTSQSVPGYVTLADASTASPPAAVANAGTAPTGATP